MNTNATIDNKKPAETRRQPYWLIYGAILLSGLLMLSEAVAYVPGQKITAKLATALIYSALALLVANGRKAGIWAAVIVWLGTLGSFLLG